MIDFFVRLVTWPELDLPLIPDDADVILVLRRLRPSFSDNSSTEYGFALAGEESFELFDEAEDGVDGLEVAAGSFPLEGEAAVAKPLDAGSVLLAVLCSAEPVATSVVGDVGVDSELTKETMLVNEGDAGKRDVDVSVTIIKGGIAFGLEGSAILTKFLLPQRLM